ncbi:MAG TPA: DUF1569 domain-containing protein [Thermoanaerobaculia bacterium]|nr:DUF1569 domain-containing protein [Thermoanaerobaculia bacterium]
MKSLWDPNARLEILRRIDRLTPETRPRWGRMNAEEMLAHITAGMRMGLGELPTRERRTIFRYWPLKHLFVYWIPFPRSAYAPREMITRGKSVTWDAAAAALRDAIARFSLLTPRDRAWPVHPIFGSLSGNAWGALGWRHLDHHLRQFGL